MSSEAAALNSFQFPRNFALQADCDDFFAWAEVEHRRNTMSLLEASALLNVDMITALQMINEGTLCASIDESSGDWLVKTACVRAQLADTVSIAEVKNAFEVATTVDPMPNLRPVKHTTDHIREELYSYVASFDGEKPRVMSKISKLNIQYASADENFIEEYSEESQEKTFDRAKITAQSIESVMESLDFANVRLEGSMYRIGYLEAQVQSMTSQLELMNEYRATAAKTIITERKNDILKEDVWRLKHKVQTQEQQIRILENNLADANVSLARLEQTWWFKLFAWLFNYKLH